MRSKANFKTKNLDRAAYLICLGATFRGVEGRVLEATWFLEVPSEVFEKEKKQEKIHYKRYMNIRQTMKEDQRAHNGFNRRYKGSTGGFKLGDIAIVKSW